MSHTYIRRMMYVHITPGPWATLKSRAHKLTTHGQYPRVLSTLELDNLRTFCWRCHLFLSLKTICWLLVLCQAKDTQKQPDLVSPFLPLFHPERRALVRINQYKLSLTIRTRGRINAGRFPHAGGCPCVCTNSSVSLYLLPYRDRTSCSLMNITDLQASLSPVSATRFPVWQPWDYRCVYYWVLFLSGFWES